MRTIWKYPVPLQDRAVLMMPRGAHILTAQMQGATLCLWAEVERTAHDTPVGVAVVGTGHPLPEGNWRYLSTVQDRGVVWHVYIETA